jgi:dimethylaniline monooxygenase (N-oxide forming)
MAKFKIAVIGAGLAGLNSARHAMDFDCDVTVFEQSDKIGGTWVLSDEIGKNKYGLTIHSSMYKGLHTNLPKEIMGFPDFPFPESEKSFVAATEVLNFLNDYADKFYLRKLIRFEHHIIKVHPKNDGTWEVTVKDLPLDRIEVLNFDAVFVCNGHYSEPRMPNIPCMDIFEGAQLHSHDFRDPANYNGKLMDYFQI